MMVASAWARRRSQLSGGVEVTEESMHELSIAMSIVEMAEEEAEQRSAHVRRSISSLARWLAS